MIATTLGCERESKAMNNDHASNTTRSFSGIRDKDGVTIYINQRAYSLYVLWRCCFYQERSDFAQLCCPIAEIYATYYRLARKFDLVVETILPHQVEYFIRSFQKDGILCILNKQPSSSPSGSKGGEGSFVPCCVISSKWAFWYQGLLSDSIAGGCLDIVLRHLDRKIVPLGKSLAQTQQHRVTPVGKESTRNRLSEGMHAPVLFSQRHGDRSQPMIKKEHISLNLTEPSMFDPLISRNLPEDVYKTVLYDKVDDGKSEDSMQSEDGIHEEEEEEERVAIMSMHHPACEPKPPTKEQEEVYRYIRQLQAGQGIPRISPRAAMSTEELYEEYITQREALDNEFAKKKKLFQKARERKNRGKKTRDRLGEHGSSSSSSHTIVISKWIAWIHLQLQKSAIEESIDHAVACTPEIGEYLSLHTTTTPPTEEKKKKKKRKKRSVSRKAKRKKRASTEETAT